MDFYTHNKRSKDKYKKQPHLPSHQKTKQTNKQKKPRNKAFKGMVMKEIKDNINRWKDMFLDWKNKYCQNNYYIRQS